jgi:hypothetical protein
MYDTAGRVCVLCFVVQVKHFKNRWCRGHRFDYKLYAIGKKLVKYW